MTNGYLKRSVDNTLLAWKNSEKRKVLLLRGARQVGKSCSVRHFAEKFDYFLEVNFEKKHEVHSFFDKDFDVKEICEKLSSLFKIPVIPGKTLLFFDEIQSCPRAISSLRFFYEDYPELHVIAAGSLLEFALQELPSFGVGRLNVIFMYPLSFSEFLSAFGAESIWNEVLSSSPDKPLLEPFHSKCLEYLKKYLIIGGMPEVVADYVQNRQILNSQNILNDLITTLKSDFSKYKKRVPDLRISTVFDAVVRQSGGKFNYAKIEQLNYRQIKESLDLLVNAGLLIPVIHTSASGIPLGGGINIKKQKYLLLDTGIFQRLSGLELSEIILSNDISLINKGSIAELFAGLELLKASSCYVQNNLYFWLREKPGSNAEVDYVVQKNDKIIPIEVKSGSTGKMQSMYIFLDEKKPEFGIRTSLENFSIHNRIKVYPLYAISTIFMHKL